MFPPQCAVTNEKFGRNDAPRTPTRSRADESAPADPRHLDLDDGWGLRLVRTDWLGPEDDLTDAVHRFAGTLRPQDTLLISEKVAVMTTGRALDKDAFAPRGLAKKLVTYVRPRPGSRGISVPEKMEFLIRSVGAPRVLAACAASAVTRPLGIRGVFYRVAGPVARDLDGGRPPFEHLLFPPLSTAEARALCEGLQRRLGCGVAVVDINDYGGSVRGRSSAAPASDDIFRLMRDNPMGQRDQRTPLGVLMPPPAPTRRSAPDATP